MRTAALTLLVFVVLGATAAVASPQFAATFALTYSSQTPNSPSGIDGLMTWSDPGEPGGKPKEIQKIRLDFNRGTRFDTSALPQCRASDTKLLRRGARACPRRTRLGSVQTEGVISTGARFDTVVFLFNARRQIIVLVTVAGRVLTEFRDDVRGGSITINLSVPRGISLARLQVHVPRHVKKRHKRKVAYMRTPSKCPPTGLWTTAATFSYRDGSTQQLSATTPCRSR